MTAGTFFFCKAISALMDRWRALTTRATLRARKQVSAFFFFFPWAPRGDSVY